MRLFIHSLGASAGGGLTYLRNVVPHLAARSDIEITLLAGETAGAAIPLFDNVQVLASGTGDQGALSRFSWEQRRIPELIRKMGADVLLSAGNFAVWNSPVPQILLSRNSLYTSADFSRDLRRRGDYRLWVDTRLKAFLARKSIHRAKLTVAPSEAFARELHVWSGHDVVALHHGFDREFFLQNGTALPLPILQKLKEAEGAVRLLFVSHYNYYRNFETLLRHLYRSCDLYVTPAYTETFAHPLVEAMASGLPIIASDLAVHREITNGAALFFERFSPADLADKVIQLLDSRSLQSDLRERGLVQAKTFSWKNHAGHLLEMASTLTKAA